MNDPDRALDMACLPRSARRIAPASWYTMHRRRARTRSIFRRTWQYVGRSEQLIRIGDFFTAALGDVRSSSSATRVA
jgi:hypothetical protein